MSSLVITCDEIPVPPLNGNNRKVHDIIKALCGHYQLHVVVYPRATDDEAALHSYWGGSGVILHFIQRRTKGRHFRAVLHQLSLPTVTRNFQAECEIVRQVLIGDPEAKVLIDLISGSPLCRYLSGGVVISGHDCMSHFWKEMGRWAPDRGSIIKAYVRRRFALQAERKFYHLAHHVHVVSRLDEQELLHINPKARYVVIPLGGPSADEKNLLPHCDRYGGIIWGNLDFPPIAQGLHRLLEGIDPGLRLTGWKLIGGLPKSTALARFPLIAALGLEYISRAADLEKILGSVRYLVLPDLAGAGQKNRCLDGLRHGCCVVGLPEVFRDLPGQLGREFIQFESPEEMGRNWPDLVRHDSAMIGAAGRKLFQQHFTIETLGARWRELIADMPPVRLQT